MTTMILKGTSDHCQMHMVFLLLVENNAEGSLKSMLQETSNDEAKFN